MYWSVCFVCVRARSLVCMCVWVLSRPIWMQLYWFDSIICILKQVFNLWIKNMHWNQCKLYPLLWYSLHFLVSLAVQQGLVREGIWNRQRRWRNQRRRHRPPAECSWQKRIRCGWFRHRRGKRNNAGTAKGVGSSWRRWWIEVRWWTILEFEYLFSNNRSACTYSFKLCSVICNADVQIGMPTLS